MNYEKPVADIILFENEDIITASGDTPVDDIKDPYAVDIFN